MIKKKKKQEELQEDSEEEEKGEARTMKEDLHELLASISASVDAHEGPMTPAL